MKRYVGFVYSALATLVVFSLFFAVSCEKKQKGSHDPNAEERELIRYYIDMKEIGLRGDVKTFLDMRDSLTMDKVSAYFKNWHQPIDSAKVSDWAYNWPDVAGLPIVEDTSDGEWRRIVFKNPWVRGKDSLEKAIYPIIMFRKNGDVWKVSNASRKRSYRYLPSGKEIHVKDFTYHPFFRIPPSFHDLEKTPPDSLSTPRKPSGIIKPGKTKGK